MIDEAEFNKALPNFHKLAVEHITAPEGVYVGANFVKSYDGRWCSYISLTLNGAFLEFVISYSRFYLEPILHHLKDNNPSLKVDIEECIPEIHPVLQRTLLLLHQCETKELMESLHSETTENYLISWFGIYLGYISPLLSLRVPESAYISHSS
ncbi:uncharacterized protein CXQ87_003288 [Candidozyma duobushaemuli]|uniref:Uncharacterized protein n=1 Tax=Candidozyma duobushaemuli TaxID=1231522 RepID=A0A2V1ABX8_9ASCO|nr:uncharacterized protein CXQ87_003288 [[Candida] duobushaemulonis]PVH15448.1 hypothetical protein CXQ87_003288 [[Candida] duobushaemulonis]